MDWKYRYYPKGGGYCKINTRPVKSLNAIELLDFGEVEQIFGWSFVAGSLPIAIADEMANEAKAKLRRICPNKPISIDSYKESPPVARDNGSGIM